MAEKTPVSGTLGEFLRSRRAALTPDRAGVVWFGARRVPGLRREELAALAGVSPTYYTRLEQGQSTNASAAVIESLARALALDDDERAHLFELARPRAQRRTSGARAETASPASVRLLDSMNELPALLLGRRTEVLAWNQLAHALLAGHVPFELPKRPADRPNLTRMLFLDAHTRELHADWKTEARRAVSSLRLVAGRYREDRALAQLVGELSMQSKDFASLWSRHPVSACVSGTKRFRHPEIGEIELEFSVFERPDSSGQRLIAYTAAPRSAAESSLKLLATQASRGRAADVSVSGATVSRGG